MIHQHFKKLLSHTRLLRERVQMLAEKEENIIRPPKRVEPEKVVVELSLTSVAKATLVIIFLYLLALFVREIKDILLLFMMAIFLSAALDPSVEMLQRLKIPRQIGILIIYLCTGLVITLFISQLIPLVVNELNDLSGKIIVWIKNITDNGVSDIPYFNEILSSESNILPKEFKEDILDNIQASINEFASQLKFLAGDTFIVITKIFKSIFNLFLVLVLTFFMTTEEGKIEAYFRALFPSKYSQYIVTKSTEIKHKVGRWLSGQIFLSLTMGTLTGIGFMLIGVKYTLTLAMVAALAEFLPLVGPTITFLLAALIASNESLMHVVGVAAVCIFMQLLEGNVLIPLIMRRAVGLSPIIIIPAMLIGLKFIGVVGAILALPIATIIKIFIEDYIAKNR